VAGIIQDDEPAARPGMVQLPGSVQRPKDVVAAVDQYGEDAGQAVYAVEDLVLRQEAAVAPVARHKPQVAHQSGGCWSSPGDPIQVSI